MLGSLNDVYDLLDYLKRNGATKANITAPNLRLEVEFASKPSISEVTRIALAQANASVEHPKDDDEDDQWAASGIVPIKLKRREQMP